MKTQILPQKIKLCWSTQVQRNIVPISKWSWNKITDIQHAKCYQKSRLRKNWNIVSQRILKFKTFQESSFKIT